MLNAVKHLNVTPEIPRSAQDDEPSAHSDSPASVHTTITPPAFDFHVRRGIMAELACFDGRDGTGVIDDEQSTREEQLR